MSNYDTVTCSINDALTMQMSALSMLFANHIFVFALHALHCICSDANGLKDPETGLLTEKK